MTSKDENIKKALKLLKFLLTIDDVEVIKSSLEAIVEMLEEEINRS